MSPQASLQQFALEAVHPIIELFLLLCAIAQNRIEYHLSPTMYHLAHNQSTSP